METTAKKRTRKTALKNAQDVIVRTYRDHILQHGTRPPSVFKFCSDNGFTEGIFYDHFGSFDAVEKYIWKQFITTTRARLQADKQYLTFSAREKMLAFYYTLFEELKSSRSFILVQLSNNRRLEIIPEFMKDFRDEFQKFVDTVMDSGRAGGEIAKRPYLDKRYPSLFWLHMGFMIMYWKDDSSAAFENTDAAIEKSVNLAFDLIGKGAVDSAFDFAKFLYQTKVK